MRHDPNVEKFSKDIVHEVNVAHGLECNDQARHHIFHIVRKAVAYWKAKYDEIVQENHALRWNELGIWMRENPDATHEQITEIMQMLNQKKYIRGIRYKN